MISTFEKVMAVMFGGLYVGTSMISTVLVLRTVADYLDH